MLAKVRAFIVGMLACRDDAGLRFGYPLNLTYAKGRDFGSRLRFWCA